jgi:hypothetical protein
MRTKRRRQTEGRASLFMRGVQLLNIAGALAKRERGRALRVRWAASPRASSGPRPIRLGRPAADSDAEPPPRVARREAFDREAALGGEP